jgi:outer membrane protein assembly factor BamB
VGEGYAGPAVAASRVYVMDHDRERQQDALRCLSLETGKEMWRFAYPMAVKRNHGMSRTVPTVSGEVVVAMGPKCHVVCCDAKTGALKWGMDLVQEEGATVPPWYTGQCPLVDGEIVILAPGGKETILMAVEVAGGKVRWRTPNPLGWKMTHSSVMRTEINGVSQYVYCASGGVIGVRADDGRVLWQTTDWKIGIATVPSPVPIPGGRLFLAGGYNAGSVMLRVEQADGTWSANAEFRLKPEVFGSTQHTPVFHANRLYGIRPDGDLACLDLEGRLQWSTGQLRFGLGPFLVVNDLIYALAEGGQLSLIEPGSTECRVLAQADVLEGREAWAPMAFAEGRLLLRDLKELVCLDVAETDR